jgi:predicted Zn finger-like uncharacterized protein
LKTGVAGLIRLTCGNCQTTYRLDAAKLGANGRKVRCGQCKAVWFQDPVEDPDAPAVSVEEAAEDVFDVSGDMQDAVPEKPAADADDKPEWMLANEVAEGDLDFVPASKKTDAAETDIEGGEDNDETEDGAEDRRDVFVLPKDFGEELAPLQPQQLQSPVMTHRPMGMGAVQFGVFTFLLLAFSSMLALLALRGVIMRHAPVMDALYRPVGLGVKAPGEGLKLSGMTARDMPDKGQHRLSVTAELANATPSVVDWPSFRIEALDDRGAVVKQWISAGGEDAGATEGQTLAANTALPLELSFNDAPDHIKKVRITAVAP